MRADRSSVRLAIEEEFRQLANALTDLVDDCMQAYKIGSLVHVNTRELDPLQKFSELVALLGASRFDGVEGCESSDVGLRVIQQVNHFRPPRGFQDAGSK